MELLADRDPEEARAILDPVLERMMEAVHHYEGTVNQVMGDGIMALFGAPIAHEDHAVRACYAALRMQESIKRYATEVEQPAGLPIVMRVGLNSGEVVVRSIGSDLRMDYSAVGQTTNLAARMEQLGVPGAIYVAPATVRLAEGHVLVESLGPLQVKGIAEPVEVHKLAGAGPTRTRLQVSAIRGLTRFVGRDRAIRTLAESLEHAAASHGQLVAMVGEPGVGKSRLVWEFTRSDRTRDWMVLESSSASYGQATPYLPVIALLRAYFQIETGEDPLQKRQKVLGLDETMRPFVPALLSLLDVPVEDPVWDSLEPSERHRQITDAVNRLLVIESQKQPLLLVFEDLHWVDGETRALLGSLVESLPTARILLLVTFRPEYEQTWPDKTYYAELRLDPLSSESAEEVLDILLGADPGLRELKQLLVVRTGGIPFFLEESVQSLAENGALSGERGAYRLERAVPEIEVPATVQAVLAARIDGLAPEDKRVLQAASVIGDEVSFSLLLAITEAGEDRLRASLTRLQRAAFLYEASLFPELEYTFKHALIREVAYGGLLRARRRGLHAEIVQAIERLYADRLGDYVELLAQHASWGDLQGKAVTYFEQAAAKAMGHSAWVDAVRLLDQAVQLHEALNPNDKARQCELLLLLAEALAPAGEPQRLFEDVAERALPLAEELGDGARAAQICQLALEALFSWGVGNAVDTPAFGRWAKRLDGHAALRTRAGLNADTMLAQVYLRADHWAEARRLERRARATARELGDAESLFQAAAKTMTPLWAPGDCRELVSLAQELADHPREGIRYQTLASFLLYGADMLLVAGERKRAEALWRERADLGAHWHDAGLRTSAPLAEARGAVLNGDLEGAIARAEGLVTLSAESGSPAFGSAAAWAIRFWPLLWLGRAEELASQDPLRTSEERLADLGWAGGLWLAHQGRMDEVRPWLHQSLKKIEISHEAAARTLAWLLEPAVLVGDPVAAEPLAIALEGVPSVTVPMSAVARHLGGAARLLGNPSAAHEHYERALVWAANIRFRPEVALTRLDLAELLLDGDGKERAEGLEHLDFVIAEFRAMKMQPALDRALADKRLLKALAPVPPA